MNHYGQQIPYNTVAQPQQNATDGQVVYYQMNTKNQSFLMMVDYLSRIGIKNNKFFMVLFDPTLYNVDPFDPNLPPHIATRVFMECSRNYWYFIRECVRIPDQGSSGAGMPYKLDRANLALNFCMTLNLNIFEEIPRQFGKTIGVCCRLLWEFLFGTTNSEMMFANKKHDDSKNNLARLKRLREGLPSYLRVKDEYGSRGGRIKSKDTVEKLSNPVNGNSIVTLPSARNVFGAQNLGRGCTQPRQWYDEYAFMAFNREIYLAATPAYSTASDNARRNGAPYGIVITTTPGDLKNDAGVEAWNTKEMSTPFSENWYDLTYAEIMELIAENTRSNFVHIRYTYLQLGAGEEYLSRMIVELKNDWVAIRRECLLEWLDSVDNSPFTKEELLAVKNKVKDPIGKIILGKNYEVNVYKPVDLQRNPPIIGVDVSGGYQRDSSTMVVLDSKTTDVIADFRCNYVSPPTLAKLIIEFVTKYANRAVVNVERNGGFGASVLALLINSPIKNNLYYEYKDKVIEERYDGFKINKTKVNTKVYGLDSSKNVRNELMDILRQRMENHKDKFVSLQLYQELSELEVKKSGKIEHCSNGHDDLIFAYLMALYVWYNGKNLAQNWGIRKSALISDSNEAEEIVGMNAQEQNLKNISPHINNPTYDENGEVIDPLRDQMDFINENRTYTQAELHQRIYMDDERHLLNLLQTPRGKKAYKEKYGLADEELDVITGGFYTLTPKDISNFYNDASESTSGDNGSDAFTRLDNILNSYDPFN